MKNSLHTILAVLLGAALSSATIVEEGGGGIVYGSDYIFLLQVPKGWVMDCGSAVNQGIHCVFYPKGSNWKDSPVVMYASSRPKTRDIVTADDAAKDFVEEFHAKGHPEYRAKRIKTLKTDSGREAVIYHFNGDRWGNSEAVAYFVEDKTINFVVMTSSDPKRFASSLELLADSLGTFEALVKSYMFMGENRPPTKEELKTAKPLLPELKREQEKQHATKVIPSTPAPADDRTDEQVQRDKHEVKAPAKVTTQYRVSMADGVITLSQMTDGKRLAAIPVTVPGLSFGSKAPTRDELRHVALDMAAVIVAGNGERAREHDLDRSEPVITGKDVGEHRGNIMTATFEHDVGFVIETDTEITERGEWEATVDMFKPGEMK
jgi:hypothetical protein